MIFFAVASPTPGKSSSSFAEAVFRSTFAEEAAEAVFSERVVAADVDLSELFSDLDFFSGFSLWDAFSLRDAFVPPLTVTSDEILSIVADETPARERSATEAYGLPAMIF